jgi:mRNA interferase RelE/StbE
MKHWKVGIAEGAKKQLAAIEDTRIRENIVKRIDRLQDEPEKQGKLLKDDLAGYRSVRAVGQRYRIIFRIENELILVVVVAIGIRKEGDKKDAYALAKKLAKLDLLD